MKEGKVKLNAGALALCELLRENIDTIVEETLKQYVTPRQRDATNDARMRIAELVRILLNENA